jgi:Arc/MetJ-type ribon-helix-helix transcriptional regulator
MDVTLPADLTKQVEHELSSGHYRSCDELIEQAVRPQSGMNIRWTTRTLELKLG